MIKKLLNNSYLTWILFSMYLLILTWVILAKMHWTLILDSDLSWLNNPEVLLHPGTTWNNFNLKLFAGTAIVNGHIDYIEPLLNVLFFIPFGVFIKVIFPKSGFIISTFSAVFLSFSYEIAQYIFAIGYADITDILTNTTGGIIGFILAIIFRKIFKENSKLIFNSLMVFLEVYILMYIYFML